MSVWPSDKGEPTETDPQASQAFLQIIYKTLSRAFPLKITSWLGQSRGNSPDYIALAKQVVGTLSILHGQSLLGEDSVWFLVTLNYGDGKAGSFDSLALAVGDG